MAIQNKQLMLIAGEASGDNLGASLIANLKQDIDCFGIGGSKMQAAGMECFIDSKELAIVGLVEIIKRLPFIIKLLKRIKRELIQRQPDAIVLIDYPGLNLRVAKIAHKLGIPVWFYVSPQIWAWRSGRINHIKKYVDHMAVLFDFERTIYQQQQIPVTVVGHPLLNTVPKYLDKTSCRQALAIPDEAKVIALIPGSRPQEIHKLLPVMLATATEIRKDIANAEFILPLAHTLDLNDIQPLLDNDIRIIQEQHYQAFKAADVAICCSGTVTLELALLATPMVIVYKMHPLSFMLGKLLVKTPYIGLSNIIAGSMVCHELLQNDVNAKCIGNEVLKLLNDNPYRDNVVNQLQRTRALLGEHHQANWCNTLLDTLPSPPEQNK